MKSRNRSRKNILLAVLVIAFAVTVSLAAYASHLDAKQPTQTTLGIRDIFACDREQKCMDEKTEIILAARSTHELLAELEEVGKQDQQILVGCHPIAHSIGRVTLSSSRNLGETFQKCDHTCHSGCYHGAMERVFLGNDYSDYASGTEFHLDPRVLQEKIPGVCNGFKKEEYGNLKFQCLHGLGHAVVFFLDYDLVNAMQGCDLLENDWERKSCYGGAVMENVVPAIQGKGMLNSDPHYPCNALAEKYRDSCYLMQTSRMLQLGLSYEKIRDQCEAVGEYRNTCMKSLGRDASNDARKDATSQGAAICMKLETEDDKQFCIKGLVYALTDNSWDGRYAFPYCDRLPETYQEFCYEETISHLRTSLYIDKSKVARSCEDYSSYAECKRVLNKY